MRSWKSSTPGIAYVSVDRTGRPWRLECTNGRSGTMTYAPLNGRVQVNNGETVRRLAIAGLGLARLARFHVQPDIDAGLLVPVLEDFNPGDVETFSAVYVGHEHLAARIRAFVDFLAENMKVGGKRALAG